MPVLAIENVSKQSKVESKTFLEHLQVFQNVNKHTLRPDLATFTAHQ